MLFNSIYKTAVCFVLAYFFLSDVCSNDEVTTDKLVKVIMLFRHGMRAPIRRFDLEGDIAKEDSFWPNGYGNLLKHGKWQLFHLGQKIRERYHEFLTPFDDFVDRDIRIVTTPVHRCYQSAYFLVSGLYPSFTYETWSEEIKEHRIPILYQSPDQTATVLTKRDICPSYHKEMRKFHSNFNSSQMQYFVNFISSHTNYVNLTNEVDVFMFIDSIIAKSAAGIELPKWLSKEYLDKQWKYFIDNFSLLSANTKMRRLIVGLLIEDIILRIKEVICGYPKNSKMFLYAGHDSSIHALSRSLGFDIKFVPSYAASLTFEIYRFAPTDYRIQLLYSKNHTFADLEVWRIPECGRYCPVGRFVQLTEKYIPRNWTEECHS